MRNILLTGEYPPDRGGVARYLENIVSLFPDHFVVRRPPSWPKWLPSVWMLIRDRATYDRVWVSHILPLGTAAWLASLMTGKSYIVILHGMDFELALRSWRKRLLTRLILRRARLVIGNTHDLLKRVQDFVHLREGIVVYPTLSQSLSSVAVSNTSVTSEIFHVLTVARLVARKNHRVVIEALLKLPMTYYTIVGSGPEEDALATLIVERIPNRAGIYTHVGDRDLLEHYKNADVFVLTPTDDKTDREGFGIVYLEAAFAGLPIIAADLPGVREALCPDGVIMLSSVTPEILAAALQDLANDPARRRRMGEANRRWVEKNFMPASQKSVLEPFV